MSLKMCQNTLDKLYYSELLFSAFRIIFVPSARSALSHLLYARCQQRQSPSNCGTQTHPASKRHISVEEETNEQRSPCATQSLSFSPRLLRPLPDERTASVRTCSSGASALRSVWGVWVGGGGADTHRRSWGEGGVNGTISWEVRVSEPRRAPTSRGVTSCLTQPNMWSEQIQVNKRRDQTADKDPEFIWLQAKHVFISADMMEQCRISI